LGEVYFNSAAVVNDTVQMLAGAGMGEVQTQGVNIAVGSSATIEVDLYSEAPLGDWTVSAIDAPLATTAPASPFLTFAWDKTTGQNGDKLHLTITSNAIDSSVDGAVFLIYSKYDATHAHGWYGFVGYH
jgi:hypothetical protein